MPPDTNSQSIVNLIDAIGEEERLVIVRKSNGISAVAVSLEVSNRLCSIFARRRASSTSPAEDVVCKKGSAYLSRLRSANRREVGEKLAQSARMRNIHRVASPITLPSFSHLRGPCLPVLALFSPNRYRSELKHSRNVPLKETM